MSNSTNGLKRALAMVEEIEMSVSKNTAAGVFRSQPPISLKPIRYSLSSTTSYPMQMGQQFISPQVKTAPFKKRRVTISNNAGNLLPVDPMVDLLLIKNEEFAEQMPAPILVKNEQTGTRGIFRRDVIGGPSPRVQYFSASNLFVCYRRSFNLFLGSPSISSPAWNRNSTGMAVKSNLRQDENEEQEFVAIRLPDGRIKCPRCTTVLKNVATYKGHTRTVHKIQACDFLFNKH